MAFNILDLFGPSAVNRLLQPAHGIQGVQNMMTAPRFIPNPPAIAGVPAEVPQVAQPAPAMPVAPQAVQQPVATPMQQPVQQPQVAPQGGGFLNGYRNFTQSDTGQSLNDFFTGLAQGSTAQESLAFGAKNLSQNRQTRQQKNQTIDWLKSKGVNDADASQIAASPPALSQFLQKLNQGADPLAALQLTKAQLDIQKSQIDIQNSLNPGEKWQKLDDSTLFDPRTGTTRSVAQTGGTDNSTFKFSGNSVEAQSLNGLIVSGDLTPNQAQQLGAGKTITGTDGEVIFMTPQGIFKRPVDGGAPTPVSPGSNPSGMANPTNQNVRAESAPASAQGTPTTTPDTANSGMIPLTQPKVTIDQSKAGGFADRMSQSNSVINDLEQTSAGYIERGLSRVPGGVGNYLVSDNYQKVDQAKRDFINAQLRRESGAVISDQEFANAEQQYFPQPGDSQAVIEQKRRSRETVVNSMVRDSGKAYRPQEAQGTPQPGTVQDGYRFLGGDPANPSSWQRAN